MSLSKLTSVFALAAVSDAQCQKFSEKYADGAAMIEALWYDAMIIATDDAKGYDLWFPNASSNPNDELTKVLVADGTIVIANDTHFDEDGNVDRCYLNYGHKAEEGLLENTAHPDTDPASFTICTPWKERGCCTHDTVENMTKFRQLFAEWYGFGGACGALSSACEELFVQQECFYSCEPNAGLFRAFKQSADDAHGNEGIVYDASDPDHENHDWMMKGMPIKASYATAFYEACKDDIVGWPTEPPSAAPSAAEDNSGVSCLPQVAAAVAAIAWLF